MRDRLLMLVFAGTLCLSAFLLFSIQPFFTKMLLPRLGGSPAVWSVAMVFFQAMLLAGYAYAHALSKVSTIKAAALVHGAVLLTAFIVLPIAIPSGWERAPETGQAIWLLGLFTTAVGLPFFAVSANGALLQAWFSRSSHPQARDPYFLYGASNIGSFASLILYIIMIEPMLTIPQQSLAWTVGYGALVVLIMACAFLLVRGRPKAASDVRAEPVASQARAAAVLKWIALGFIPSGLLVAVTAHITTDVASAPFLWVLPLALFLLTFVLAFKAKPFIPVPLLAAVLPILAAIVIASLFLRFGLPVWAPLILHVVFFFLAALYCHSILYGIRPEASSLTAFYLAMSFGGVLGGAFASLIAPLTFNWVAEYPILIAAVLLVRPWRLSWVKLQWVLIGAVFALLLGMLARASVSATQLPQTAALLLVCTVVLMALVQFRWKNAYLGFVGALIPLAFLYQNASPQLFRERSFFGVIEVNQSFDGQVNRLSHGTTLHGAERVADANGAPVKGTPVPLTYYHAKSGIATTIKAVQDAAAGVANGRFGVVGLGAGSVACYARPGEAWTFYEIDKVVVDAARNNKLFRFIDACGLRMPIVLGDARLTVAAEPDRSFDYLLIDAFSSDSIPTHLMTRESLALFRQKVTDDGLLVFHISNRYLELPSVMAAIARDLGLPIRIGEFPGDPSLAMSTNSTVALLTTNQDVLRAFDTDPRWTTPQAGTTEPWTDDYSNIFAALMRRHGWN